MGISSPIIGALWQGGRQSAGVLPAPAGGLLETELGFVLAQPVTSAVTAAQVPALIDRVHAMVELAQPGLAGKPHGIDLAAVNSASHRYLVGPALGPDWALDELRTQLCLGDEVLFEGRCGDVLGGQHEALAWLMNEVLDVGYGLAAGQLLMTGAVGGASPRQSRQLQRQFSKRRGRQPGHELHPDHLSREPGTAGHRGAIAVRESCPQAAAPYPCPQTRINSS